jgi:hypothetical protein
MNKPAEIRVSDGGATFTAAPNKEGRLGPQPIKGSTPRNWETRLSGECAAIVKTIRAPGEWPVHLSCCLPVANGSPYCSGHKITWDGGASTKDLIRSVRRYT